MRARAPIHVDLAAVASGGGLGSGVGGQGTPRMCCGEWVVAGEARASTQDSSLLSWTMHPAAALAKLLLGLVASSEANVREVEAAAMATLSSTPSRENGQGLSKRSGKEARKLTKVKHEISQK